MKQLTRDDIEKNRVETINQYKVLEYLKKNLNIYEFEIFLYDKDTIKVIDLENKQAYFRYDKDNKEVLFLEEDLEETMNLFWAVYTLVYTNFPFKIRNLDVKNFICIYKN